MLFLVLYLCADAAKIVEYRLGSNYGQVFRDFSNNGRHAVNGESSTTNNFDTFPTDRGAYTFNYKESYVKLPINDISSSSYNLPSTISIVFWMMARDDSGRIMTRYKISDSGNWNYFIRRISQSDVLEISFTISGVTTTFKSSNFMCVRGKF
jgi:hypothetical protein